VRILYVGKFERPYSTENYVTWALRDQGVFVQQRAHNTLKRLSTAQDLVRIHNIDVVLFSKASVPCIRELLPWCKEQKILTVCWQWDLFFGYRTQRPPQFKADLLLTTDGGHDAAFRKHGSNHRLLRQGIHKPEHVLYPPNYKHDVAFVGSQGGHTSRLRLLRWLKNTYGTQFVRHRTVRGLNLNKAMAQAKIIIGDSYPSKNYWSNRIYEIIGRGGFFMHPRVDGLSTEFTDGMHYVSYKRGDFDQLGHRIGVCLRDDDAREKVRRLGFKRCGERFTYSHRVTELLRHINTELEKRGLPVK